MKLSGIPRTAKEICANLSVCFAPKQTKIPCDAAPFLSYPLLYIVDSCHISVPVLISAKLSGIPRLESARLLHLHGGLALLPGDGAASQAASASQAAAAAAAASSALFYNPFEEAVGGMDDEESENGDGDIDSHGGEGGGTRGGGGVVSR